VLSTGRPHSRAAEHFETKRLGGEVKEIGKKKSTWLYCEPDLVRAHAVRMSTPPGELTLTLLETEFC